MVAMATCFKRTYASMLWHAVIFSASDPRAGNCQLTPPPESHGHSQVSLVQSLLGSLLLSPGSWFAQCFVCALQESVSPVLWKFCNHIPLAFKVIFPGGGSQSFCQIPRLGNLLWALEFSQQCKNFFSIIVLQSVSCLLGGCMVGLMATSSKRTYATHCASLVCCSQSPCPCSRPLLTHTSAGDTQRQVWLSLLWGPWDLVYTRFCLSPPSVSGGYGVWF